MKHQHTQGPWRISYGFGQTTLRTRNDSDYSTLFYAAFPDQHVCVGELIQASVRSPAEAEANARLIALAPELLEFVRQYQDARDSGDFCHIDEYANELLAKASVAPTIHS